MIIQALLWPCNHISGLLADFLFHLMSSTHECDSSTSASSTYSVKFTLGYCNADSKGGRIHLPKSLLAEISMLTTTAVLLHATSGNQTLPCRQSQPEPSRPLPLTAIIGRTGHFIDALIFRQAGGDETYGGEGGCDVKDVMDFQPNEYLTKITQEWKWRDGVRWEGTCVRFPATV